MDEIKKFLGSDKILLGTEQTMKALKKGTLAKVFLSKNVPPKVKEDIMHYKELADFSVEELKLSNEELGTLCRKSFPVSVIGLLK